MRRGLSACGGPNRCRATGSARPTAPPISRSACRCARCRRESTCSPSRPPAAAVRPSATCDSTSNSPRILRSMSSAVPAAALVAGLALAVGAALPAQTPGPRWFKGNTHTHTLNSDGDSTPDDVVKWYREHGYQFLVLTDHNFLTTVEGLNALHGARDKFLVIKGEEVTDRFGDASLHINGLDVEREIAPQGGTSVVDVLQRNVDAIRAAKGVPHINHPNYRWSMTADQLRQISNNRLFEVYNGHPDVHNIGGGGVPGLEEAWDAILTSGVWLYGIAVDDAHVFKQPGNPNVAGPGRGWVMVRAARLEPRAILDALERGEFYASTGVTLRTYDVTPQKISIDVQVAATAKYRVQFVGAGGKVLKEVASPQASYDMRGDEGYVRARVIESTGRLAWTQPIAAK